ncbi:MAG TPA: hypothetical protein VFV80_06275 [Geminicoccaceae bacterium]|nr:hypothetical protein [Geminicoccaceae bacterium]
MMTKAKSAAADAADPAASSASVDTSTWAMLSDSKVAEPFPTRQYSVPGADVASTTVDVVAEEARAPDLCQAPDRPDA